MTLGRVVYWQGLGDEPGLTLQVMGFLIQRAAKEPWARRLAAYLTQDARTPQQQAQAIWAAVKQRVAYVEDPPGQEWVQDPLVTLAVARKGDCDDMAVAAGALLGALGHVVRPVAVQWEDMDAPSHAVLEDRTAGVIVDPVTLPPDRWPPYDVHRLVTR